MNKSRKITIMIKVCGWVIIVNTMLFFLLPVPFGAPAHCAARHAAGAYADQAFARYGMTVLRSLAVSPAELLILGDNQVLDLIISYFWRVLILCCGIGILRKDKRMRIFFLTLVGVSIVLLILGRFLGDSWNGANLCLFQNDMISLLVMFIYIAFLKFPPVQKEFI